MSYVLPALALVALLAGFGSPVVARIAPVAPAEVTIIARDYAFEAPDTIPAGVTSIRMRDRGKEQHHWVLFRLADSVSLEEFYRDMKDGGASPAGIASLGGSQDSIAVSLDLATGRYVLGCLHGSPDGTSHLAKGMFRALTVRARRSGDGPRARAPRVDATVTMRDYGYSLSGPSLRAGRRTLRLENAGPQEHHVMLQRLEPGKSLADVERFFADGRRGPRPMRPVSGGTTRQSVGETLYWTIDVEAGGYLFLCRVPDAGDARPHVDHGMRQEIRVLAVAP